MPLRVNEVPLFVTSWVSLSNSKGTLIWWLPAVTEIKLFAASIEFNVMEFPVVESIL